MRYICLCICVITFCLFLLCFVFGLKVDDGLVDCDWLRRFIVVSCLNIVSVNFVGLFVLLIVLWYYSDSTHMFCWYCIGLVLIVWILFWVLLFVLDVSLIWILYFNCFGGLLWFVSLLVCCCVDLDCFAGLLVVVVCWILWLYVCCLIVFGV